MSKPECPDCGRPMTCGHCEMCSPPIEALKAGKRLVENERDKLRELAVRYAYSLRPRFNGPQPIPWAVLTAKTRGQLRDRFDEWLARGN